MLNLMRELGLVSATNYKNTSSVLEFEADFEADPAQLLPQLLDRLIELGQMAQQLNHALGGNGHRPEQAAQLIEELAKR